MKCLFVLLLLHSCGFAADFFVTPEGAGTRDASRAEHAAAGTSISSLFDRMAAGDRLLLGAGNYQGLSLAFTSGGSPGRPKIVEGAPGAIFTSDWSIEKPDKGSTAIVLGPGLSHVVFKNLSISRYCFAIRAAPSKESPRSHLTFENIAIDQVRHGFYLADCDDLAVLHCTTKRYSKHGFRFDQGCDRVALKGCVADCSEGDPVWETKTEVFPFGFILNDGGAPNTGFLLEDCVAKNNIKSNQTVKYTNGDGFVAEGNNSDVRFARCHALRNQDGGFDIKVDHAKFTDCVATGHRRDFRIWRSATLKNCFAGGSQTGLWTQGGPVAVESCTFLAHRKCALEIEDKSTGPVTLTNCLIVSEEQDYTVSIGRFEGAESTVVAKTSAGFGFASPDSKWNGDCKAMDSSKFPDKGFNSARISR
ncbi:right-handed parallel beta-helix repeat-containing protein [Luteolibacter sp. Populi]|uniref:right-handed parallel beta-helix repeat-containing protein n=1 Tax=Luteolibacter sp. Populi TaxID=3230487 RepID=UPI0034669050